MCLLKLNLCPEAIIGHRKQTLAPFPPPTPPPSAVVFALSDEAPNNYFDVLLVMTQHGDAGILIKTLPSNKQAVYIHTFNPKFNFGLVNTSN